MTCLQIIKKSSLKKQERNARVKVSVNAKLEAEVFTQLIWALQCCDSSNHPVISEAAAIQSSRSTPQWLCVSTLSAAQTFIKVVNYQHLMPTRYTLEVDLKNLVTPESLENVTKRKETRKVWAPQSNLSLQASQTESCKRP